MIDPHGGSRQGRDLIAGDERASTGSDRAKLRHRLAITRDHESVTSGYRFDHLGILIAQFALSDSSNHQPIVAECATVGYALR